MGPDHMANMPPDAMGSMSGTYGEYAPRCDGWYDTRSYGEYAPRGDGWYGTRSYGEYAPEAMGGMSPAIWK